MVQYDLILSQNTAPTGKEFTERVVKLNKGDLLSSLADNTPAVLSGAGKNGYMLVRDDAELTGWKLIPIEAGHTQGTDLGTTSDIFELGSALKKIELTAESASKLGAKVDGGATYADFQAKDATFNKVTVAAAPSAASDLANKGYVDGLISANDVMKFAGTIGTGGLYTIAAFNALTTYEAGWVFRIIEAGTIKGFVCEVDDIITVIVDRAGSGNLNTDFYVSQGNKDGIVIGPAAATDNYPVLFNGATGKLVKAGSGALGSAAYTPSNDYATAAQGILAANAIPKGLITNVNQVVIGSAIGTPGVLQLTASTLVGMKATGGAAVLSKADALAILNVTEGATANAKASNAEVDTGTDDVKFITPLALSGSKMVKGPGTVVDNVPVVFDGTSGKLVKQHASGALGTAAFAATGAFATAAQGSAADAAVPKALFDANTILYATVDNTPAALAVGASTILGRKASGNIAAMSAVEVAALLLVAAPANANSTGVVGQMACDGNYWYYCYATNAWCKSLMAKNWN